MAKTPPSEKAKELSREHSAAELKKTDKIKPAPEHEGARNHHIAENTMKEAVTLAMENLYIPRGVKKEPTALKSKWVRNSAIKHYDTVFPEQLNPNGTIHGGQIMKKMDLASSISARLHVGNAYCVTKSTDGFDFKAPAFLGDILVYKASVNRVWGTSMEVGVRVDAISPMSGKQWHICSNYFTYVALGADKNKVSIGPVIPITKAEKRRFKEAGGRRKKRLQNNKK
ncbi:MAG: acyl-CoA thioesterase [Candidatus Niyogibacteria bacterium CG10_big_fil_rev_8_21_14_0_10_46_36]|uniref:Acyl-CoA thioesterase n=1 Tax=Candidatus Niyogibacteria bacterium CG10_big_fil_rev_8_21_14_0_10_46_36 TaxID=1974726 RepID=A0A2H0TD09_9BACT|nr:MAG: acyl-CoA thioesterase [Candidatus Niyogibacteria bacterium CG10_big_fil_rev_8_21_14_0_10_46_36]